MKAEIIAEIATAHGGDVDLAADMIKAAADAGADTIKLQSYDIAKLRKADPQYDWLVKAHLDRAAHERLIQVAADCGVKFLSTPFGPGSLQMLRELGLTRFKIASSQSHETWWRPQDHEWGQFIVSYPWGKIQDEREPAWQPDWRQYALTAIPLYPTPLECVQQATLLDGWSDHTEGLAACRWALAQGIRCLEIHMCLPDRSRMMPFDKTSEQVRALRGFAEACATMRSGVSEVYRSRWSA